MKNIPYGSDLKILLTLDKPSEIETSIDDIDLLVKISFSNGTSITMKKEQLVKVDSFHYIACIKSDKTSKGDVRVSLTSLIPDNDFSDGIYKNVSFEQHLSLI